MVNNRKYPKLTGVCEKAIQNQWCLGCQKLGDYNFTGVNYCKYADIGRKEHLPDVSNMVTDYKQLKI